MSFAAPRRAQTLLELIAALTLLSVTLVPALRLLRDAHTLSTQIESRELLATLCSSKLEEHLALTSAAWSATTVSGTFAAEGYANVRFQAVRSDAPASGGVTGKLMALTVTVWDDANGNAVLDSGERSTIFATKVANLGEYPA